MAKESGKSIKMSQIVIAMMVSIKTTRKTAMAYLFGKVEMSIKVIIKMTKEMDMEKCFG
jgi:lysophospholipid acyltransferase (LPLAT)-like uncharacterized protein